MLNFRLQEHPQILHGMTKDTNLLSKLLKLQNNCL